MQPGLSSLLAHAIPDTEMELQELRTYCEQEDSGIEWNSEPSSQTSFSTLVLFDFCIVEGASPA